MLALIETKTAYGYGPQKIVSRKVINITGRNYGTFENKNTGTTYMFSEEGKIYNSSNYGTHYESTIRALHPKQSLTKKFPHPFN